MINVFVAGTFDLIHSGHFNLLLFARQLAGDHGKVHVSIDTDEKITADKGPNRPIHPFNIRFEQLVSIQFNGKRLVDYIHQHESNEALAERIRATRFFNGGNRLYIVVGDSYVGKKVVGSEEGLVIHYPQNHFSSSAIINAILEKHGANS